MHIRNSFMLFCISVICGVWTVPFLLILYRDDPEPATAVAPPVVAPPELPPSELASYEEAQPPLEEVMPSAEPESAFMERSGEELRNRAAQ